MSQRVAGLALVLGLGTGPAVLPQQGASSAVQQIQTLAAEPAVQRALELTRSLEPPSERELVELTEIPAPPFGEAARGTRYAEMLREAGLEDVSIDEVGNVLARRPGRAGERTVALVAHLDTVFPADTDVTVRRRADRLYAPGIGDDTRGLVVLLNMVRALDRAQVETHADLLFVGSVGEEGLGDLRGVRHLFRDGATPIDALIAIDGGSDSRVVNQALGSRRYRVAVTGPGGHSWGDFGLGNPALALGRAIYYFDEAAAAIVNAGAPASYNIGRIGGGTSVNAVPHENWAEVDMRSVDPEQLDRLDRALAASVEQAVDELNRRRDRGTALEAALDLIGDRPSGTLADDHPLVAQAMAVTRYLGFQPRLGAASTDANIPIALGIPAVTIGRGGAGAGAHSLDEWWAPRDAHIAVQRALLLGVASAGLAR